MAIRDDRDLPAATAQWGWRFHHLGIPTQEPRSGETFIESLGMHVSGFETSPFGVEWMRFEPDSPVHELVQSQPHLAFVVDDIEQALAGKEILTPPNSPSQGLTVAMILHEGAPIEIMQFSDESPIQEEGKEPGKGS